MNSDTMLKASIVLICISIIIGGVSVWSSHSDDGDKDTKYTLYFGINDGTEESYDAFETAIKDYIVDNKLGYTMHWAEGGYIGPDGKPIHDEKTLVVIIAFTDRAFVDKLVDHAKTEFGIKSVLVEKMSGDIELM